MIKHAKIEDLAYLIKKAKECKQEKPIIFLGAGASKSGGIPLASEIVEAILEQYKTKPNIKRHIDGNGDRNYTILMDLLEPHERNLLLKEYIDNAKINVTHIYLAQLINAGYIDYVLTVNFDNLMLRALALYNEFLPTYDMAILKDLTTTTFKEKSIVYLHGQSHGLWLLNTEDEFKKVEKIIPKIFDSIKDRPWIFVGYSGNDKIFDHVVNLGRFDKSLYWIGYQDNEPNEKVCKSLLEQEHTNSFLIKGYDSDSFMLELNRELSLPQPEILSKQFSALGKYLENIVDIDNDEKFKDVKERLNAAKEEVDIAIWLFEQQFVNPGNTDQILQFMQKIGVFALRKQIIDETLKLEFDSTIMLQIEKMVTSTEDEECNMLFSDLLNNWGLVISESNESNEDKLLISIEKYKQAARFNPNSDPVFYNWGNELLYLARLKNIDSLYYESFEKYEKAVLLNPNKSKAYSNYGASLLELAQRKQHDKILYGRAVEKIRKAIELDPEDTIAKSNLAFCLSKL